MYIHIDKAGKLELSNKNRNHGKHHTCTHPEKRSLVMTQVCSHDSNYNV